MPLAKAGAICKGSSGLAMVVLQSPALRTASAGRALLAAFAAAQRRIRSAVGRQKSRLVSQNRYALCKLYYLQRGSTMTQAGQTNEDEQKVEYLNTLKSHLDKELEQIGAHAQWYHGQAAKSKTRYYLIRFPIILLSFALPFLLMLEVGKQGLSPFTVAASLVSLLVAALSTIDTFFGYGKTWLEERAAELALYRLKREYRTQRIGIDAPHSVDEAIETAESLIDSLRNEYEQIVAGTIEAFIVRAERAESEKPDLRLVG
ncbi:MAG: DUF4231 domain-containing protein [Gammaproteobacteria bacterium]|nr:MAG: DUF4231 domain-containing protein [Gammaproteobacteria bacterium]